jgi:hypothetical protein
MKKILHTCPWYTAGLAAVYRTSRAVSRPDRAGVGGSGRGAAYRSCRALYRTLAAVYRRRRRGWRDGATDQRALAAEGATGVTGDRLELLLGHPCHLGFMGLNGPTHDFFLFL